MFCDTINMRQRLLSAIFADSRRCVSTRITIDALSLIIGLMAHITHISLIRFISLIIFPFRDLQYHLADFVAFAHDIEAMAGVGYADTLYGVVFGGGVVGFVGRYFDYGAGQFAADACVLVSEDVHILFLG